MDINDARTILAKNGFLFVKLIDEYNDASVYLCKRRNGTEIEVAILNDGSVIVAPE